MTGVQTCALPISQICNLFIQCWLIKKFLFKPVCAIIEKRRALADSQIQDAKKAKEEGLPVLSTDKTAYEVCGMMNQAGIAPPVN